MFFDSIKNFADRCRPSRDTIFQISSALLALFATSLNYCSIWWIDSSICMPVSGTADSQYSTAMMRWHHGMGSWDRYAHSNFIPSPHSINRLKNFIQKYGICAHSHYSLSWKLAPCACSSHTEKENGSERNGSWMKWNLQQRYKFPKGRRSVQQTFPTMRCTRLA